MIGRTISHYEILEKIGEGGMGVVYKAQDTKLNRTVALKFLAPELTRHTEKKKRFLREARTISSLDHPNIAVVYDIDESDDGRSFISMAYYDGVTLKDKIEREKPDIETIIKLTKEILAGLQRAHEAGIVHRDIKPANILVTGRNETKILDFGLAKLNQPDDLSRSGQVLGTAAYMSPEQLSGKPIDHRSDLFSLGILLYELTTGKHPFMEEHPEATLYAIVNTDPAAPSKLRGDVPEPLEQVILKLLEKNPERRYQSAAEAFHSLENVSAVSEGKKYSGNSNRKVATLLAGAGVLLVILLLYILPVQEAAMNLLGLSSLPDEKRLAVLPLTNIGEDPRHQSFTDGFTEVIASTITEMDMFRGAFGVIPTRDVRSAEIKTIDQARRVLDATLVIDGSVYRTDDTIRLTINLIDTGTRRYLRSGTIEDSVDNLAGLQREAIRRIEKMLEMELRPEEYRIVSAGSTRNSKAYDHYINGVGLLKRHELLENVSNAIEQFYRSIDIDPSFARSYVGLGEAYWRKYELTNDPVYIERALEQSRRAIELDDNLTAAYVTLGMIQRGIRQYDEALRYLNKALEFDRANPDALREIAGVYAGTGDLQRAEETYRQAIRLRPGFWVGYNEFGIFYLHRGRYEEAKEQFQRVVEITPDNLLGYNHLGAVYYLEGQPEKAREMFERSKEINPNVLALSNLGTMSYYAGDYAGAARLYEQLLTIDEQDHHVWGFLASAYQWAGADRDTVEYLYRQAANLAERNRKIYPEDPGLLASLGSYYAELGNRTEAIELLEQALEYTQHDYSIAYRIGVTYEDLGDRDRALELIKQALEEGYPLFEIKNSPALQELRNDPRFKNIIDSYSN